jgi:hypothetical protein
VSLTIPAAWSTTPSADPEALLLLRAFGDGPSGPSSIACRVDRHAASANGAMLSREQLDGLNATLFQQVLAGEHHPTSSAVTVDGVRVSGYEAVEPANQGMVDHHFARMFVLQEGGEFARYMLLCSVTTFGAGAAGDFASTRAFLATLRIHSAPAATTP